MSGPPSAQVRGPASGSPGNIIRRWTTLRLLGIPLVLLWVAEVGLGGSLSTGPPFPSATLDSHVAIALLLTVLGLVALAASLRLPGWRPKAAAGVCLVSAAGATAAGVDFLDHGMSQGASNAMLGFALLLLVGICLVFLWGSEPRPAT